MIEHDLLGNIEVPDDKYYGAQTQRNIKLCPSATETLDSYPELIYCMAAIKKAYAYAHGKLGVFEEKQTECMIKAAEMIMDGAFSGEFPTAIVCGGGCVNIHMNLNEVAAKKANEMLSGHKGSDMVHPNSHMNKGQSTNDVIPAAIKLALYKNLIEVKKSVEVLKNAYAAKTEEYRDTVKVSRTCIQDAVPITFGQFFGASVSFLERQIDEIDAVMKECLELPLGATAVGTGLNMYAGVAELVYENLSETFGTAVTQEKNLFDGLQFADVYIRVSSILKATLTGISKMARDIRIMSSGPRSGLGEITIAPVQNGSSIMPGKVNPTLPESMNVLAYIAIGADAAVGAASEGGELELNVWEPVIISELLHLTQMIPEMVTTFAEKCVATIQVNEEHCLKEAENTLASAAVISALRGYQVGTEVAQYADKKGLSMKAAAVEFGCLSKEEAEELLDPLMLTEAEKTGKLFLDIDKNSKK